MRTVWILRQLISWQCRVLLLPRLHTEIDIVMSFVISGGDDVDPSALMSSARFLTSPTYHPHLCSYGLAFPLLLPRGFSLSICTHGSRSYRKLRTRLPRYRQSCELKRTPLGIYTPVLLPMTIVRDILWLCNSLLESCRMLYLFLFWGNGPLYVSATDRSLSPFQPGTFWSLLSWSFFVTPGPRTGACWSGPCRLCIRTSCAHDMQKARYLKFGGFRSPSTMNVFSKRRSPLGSVLLYLSLQRMQVLQPPFRIGSTSSYVILPTWVSLSGSHLRNFRPWHWFYRCHCDVHNAPVRQILELFQPYHIPDGSYVVGQ